MPSDGKPAIVLKIVSGQHRRVVECQSYSVERRPDGRTMIYAHDTEKPSGDPISVIALDDDEVCHALVPMARGRPLTAETIRPNEPRVAQLKVVR